MGNVLISFMLILSQLSPPAFAKTPTRYFNFSVSQLILKHYVRKFNLSRSSPKKFFDAFKNELNKRDQAYLKKVLSQVSQLPKVIYSKDGFEVVFEKNMRVSFFDPISGKASINGRPYRFDLKKSLEDQAREITLLVQSQAYFQFRLLPQAHAIPPVVIWIVGTVGGILGTALVREVVSWGTTKVIQEHISCDAPINYSEDYFNSDKNECIMGAPRRYTVSIPEYDGYKLSDLKFTACHPPGKDEGVVEYYFKIDSFPIRNHEGTEIGRRPVKVIRRLTSKRAGIKNGYQFTGYSEQIVLDKDATNKGVGKSNLPWKLYFEFENGLLDRLKNGPRSNLDLRKLKADLKATSPGSVQESVLEIKEKVDYARFQLDGLDQAITFTQTCKYFDPGLDFRGANINADSSSNNSATSQRK